MSDRFGFRGLKGAGTKTTDWVMGAAAAVGVAFVLIICVRATLKDVEKIAHGENEKRAHVTGDQDRAIGGAEVSEYSKGYHAGSRRYWPKHRPPTPPDEVIAAIVRASQDLRDAVDSQLAVLDEDDVLVKELGPMIDKFDSAMVNLSNWLTAVDDDAKQVEVPK